MIENDGIYEFIIEGKHFTSNHHDEGKLNQILKDECKNCQELENLNCLEKLSLFVHDGYGFRVNKNKMIYANPYTNNLLPKHIIYSSDSYLHGVDVPISEYDPHKNISIEIPIHVKIEYLDKDKVSINISTHSEDYILYDIFHSKEISESPVSEENLKYNIKKLWRRGYLLDDYGLVNICYYNNYVKGCIKRPWWFQGDSQEQSVQLLRFLDEI